MKSIYLKSVLAFIFVGVMAMLICGLFYNDYLEQQPATPEQLTEIAQDTPCAAEAFQETLNYQSEPLSWFPVKSLHLLFVLWFQEWHCVIYPRPQTDIFLF